MFDYTFYPKHYYTVAAENLNIKATTFTSREAANNYMYKVMGKYGLHLDHVYDDRHYKTYIFDNGVRIHINRE